MTDSIYLGQRQTYGGFQAPFFFPVSDFLRHVHVTGKTGTGKSTLLQAFIGGLIDCGHGVGILDPHGDLASWVLDQVPRERVDDVVYLNPSDPEFAPALNLVSDSIASVSRPRVASALVSAFHHLWAESWGPRLEHILYNSIRVLIDCQNVSLVALPRLLTDGTFREWAVRQCQDPFVRAFWTVEFESWDRRFRAEAIAPVLNKLGQLAAIPALRAVLGQVRSKVSFRHILDQGQILVVDLAKGKLGEDASRLLGALVTSAIGAATMERADLPPARRKDFVLVLDEAHCFLSGSVSSLLSEARKFGFGIVMSHQFLGQLPPGVRESALGNVGTSIAFRASGEDAEILARNFGHRLSANLFVDLPPYVAVYRPAYGQAVPFLLSPAAPPTRNLPYSDTIISRSRDRFCTRRSSVEEKLRRWHSSSR